MKRISACMFLGAMMTGCAAAPPPAGPADGYPISIGEAYQRLVSSDMSELRYAQQCGILIHFHPSGIPNQSVTWRVLSSGREMLRFTANLEELPNGRVKTNLWVSQDERGGEAYDGNQKYVRPAINQPVRPAIEEQIAALLEGRKFDRARLGTKWNDGCQIQRTMLQQGHRLSVTEVPPTGWRNSTAPDDAGPEWNAGPSGGGWGQ